MAGVDKRKARKSQQAAERTVGRIPSNVTPFVERPRRPQGNAVRRLASFMPAHAS